jgi:hypothetical protein
VLHMDFAVLEEAKLNEPIPESTFVLSKPKEYSVFDSRVVRDGVRVPVPVEEVEDVLSLMPAEPLLLVEGSMEDSKPPMTLSLRMRVLLILNGIVLFYVGFRLWKSASLKEPKH